MGVICLPVQLRPSLARVYPDGQEHIYVPAVFKQAAGETQLCDAEHSSISKIGNKD